VPREAERPVAPPIWLTAHYGYDSLEHYADLINERRPGYVYGRYGSPTHTALHDVLASLDDAEAAWSFASGMAAMHTVLTTLVRTEDTSSARRPCTGDVRAPGPSLPRYGSKRRSSTRPELSAVPRDTAFVGVEPWRTDVPGHGRAGSPALRRRTSTIVDNSVASPYLLRPLTIPGVTLVVHSTSKYIAGHADVTAGGRGSRELVDRIRRGDRAGNHGRRVDAWLVCAGADPPLRMERQCTNAMALAGRSSPPQVRRSATRPAVAPRSRVASTCSNEAGTARHCPSRCATGDAASRWAKSLRIAIVGSSFGGLWTE
jgi:methionine-gamma-lyase